MKRLAAVVALFVGVTLAPAQTPLGIGFLDPALPNSPPLRNAAALAFARTQGTVTRVAWQAAGGWLGDDGRVHAPEEFDVVWFHQGDDLAAAKLDVAVGSTFARPFPPPGGRRTFARPT
jgi:hypothetical protein